MLGFVQQMLLLLIVFYNSPDEVYNFFWDLLLLFYSFASFHTSICWWSSIEVWATLSLFRSPGFSIRASLNNAVVWMVSTRPLITKSSSSFTNHLGIVPSVPITVGITVTFMFFCFFFFSSLPKFKYLSLFTLSFIFTLWSDGTAKSNIRFLVDYH